MARPKIPLAIMWETAPDHLSRQILEELSMYAKDKQFYPTQRALFRYMSFPQYNPATRTNDPPRYPELEVNSFDYWYGRLVEEDYIEIDQATRSVRCVHLIITEKDKPES